ncbi:MAG: hypothetical protein KAJ58_00595 [Candidatus Pacebacteria bacterium]|nr:hypothetical protein [Candidatus Paceibacterota bacterium]
MKLKKIITSAVFMGILFVIFSFNQVDKNLQQTHVDAGSDHNVSGYAWSDNIGWISFNCIDGGAGQSDICSVSNYGVDVGADNVLSGYAWSDNIGWISFNENDLNGCPENDCRVELIGGNLVGWAKALSADNNGWDGWISLDFSTGGGAFQPDPVNYGVSLIGSEFGGFAWGSDVVGWISFNCTDTGLCGTSDYKVIYGDYSSPNITEFHVENVVTGNIPTISWVVENADRCTGDWTASTLCTTELGCASSSVEGSAVTSPTTYEITCINTVLGGFDTAIVTPSLFYELGFIEGYTGTVSVDFVVSGATTTKTKIGVIPYNGFTGSVTLSADLESADPEALPVGSYSIYSDQTLSSSEYNDGSEFSMYIADSISNGRQVSVIGNGNMFKGVEVEIRGEGITPHWEPI